MNVLVVDNYDSFTHNLAQLVAVLTGEPPRVVQNDALSVDDAIALAPDAIVLSPGPGTPERAADVGIGPALIHRLPSVPMLGVCLGHQTIGVAFGARVVRAPTPMHGRLSSLRHDGRGLFAGLATPLRVVRYHSLVLDRATLPAALRVTAETDDGLVMAIEHATRPLWGVQFHPESILSEGGRELLANFLAAARTLPRTNDAPPTHPPARLPTRSPTRATPRATPPSARIVRREVAYVDGERAFVALYRDAPHAFWLDGTGRFSYLGEAGREVVTATGTRWERRRHDHVETRDGDPFTFLDELLAERRLPPPTSTDDAPFDLAAGYVGYLGYELAEFTGGPRGPHDASSLPDLQLLLADRVLVLDHALRRAHLCCLVDDTEGHSDADALHWCRDMEARLHDLPPPPPLAPPPRASHSQPLQPFRLDRGAARYRADVARIQALLAAGETYEVCLTTQIRVPTPPSIAHPLDLYRTLRRDNPAPYSAYLRFGDACLLSASPERFVHIAPDGATGTVESRPVKGTRRRGYSDDEDAAIAAALAASEKDRAENLMIVDLVRHDLGGVCAPGSVSVPSLMAIERHPTVFQMVSTVRGQIAPDRSSVDVVRALFPGGSMTGAPKIRSMAHIAALEGAPRGPYSGGLGFFSLDGAVDLAMTIRTIVARGVGRDGELSFGVGGAVVALSDPDDEFDEALLKGKALMRAIRTAAGDPFSDDERPESTGQDR